MGKGKMDEAAAARIRKARGEKVRHVDDKPSVTGLTYIIILQDEFARRAAIAARANKDGGGQDGKDGGGSGSSSGNRGGEGSKK